MEAKPLYGWLFVAGISISASVTAAPFNPTVLGFEAPPEQGLSGICSV